MPVYEYDCLTHGVFDLIRPMHLSREGADCPSCAAACPRVLSTTRTNLVPRSVSVATARNEKSQCSPEVCSHPSAGERAPGSARQRGGLRRYHGKRPWVIEHA
jgi:putative FmdB family regulatory protein